MAQDRQGNHGPEGEDELESRRLQMFLDRKAKAQLILGNIMKRLSEAEKNVIDKLK
ncbi:hypothetical protein [Streptomyces sp. NBC_00009]|uniref:hypothetical protein n=1 Tax=Streptomyces sp. NBC_00009 TaxID=2975620 RepID=UPI00324DC15B